MQPILECCCGVDVHKDMIEACIIKGMDNPIYISVNDFLLFKMIYKIL